MNQLNDIERHRVRRTLSEFKQKLEEALRLSRRRDRVPFVTIGTVDKRPQ